MKHTSLAILVLVACGGDGVRNLPVGEGVTNLATAWCDRLVECGDIVEQQVPDCIESNQFNLCWYYFDCDTDATDSQEEQFALCEADLAERVCSEGLSEACSDLLGL